MGSRVMVVLPTRTYRARAFLQAAAREGIDVVVASNEPSSLAAFMAASYLTLDLGNPDQSAERAAELAAGRPLDGVVGVDESAVLTAAHVAARLGLRQSTVEAVESTRDKRRLRRRLAAAGVAQPPFVEVAGHRPAAAARRVAESIGFPCIVKPVDLSGSRGVIRADDEPALVAAIERTAAICSGDSGDDAEMAQGAGARRGGAVPLLAEAFVGGPEVAVEGLLRAGRLQVIAVFDKPDPLEGPYFEETLYVTPSRLPAASLADLAEATAAAVAAIGLTEGPVHAELRVTPAGPVVIEVAARSIGGLCSQAVVLESGRSLEQVILRAAVGWDLGDLSLAAGASGVLMLPIPRAGRLIEVAGVEAARAVPGITAVEIAIPPGEMVFPLPEGDRYLGFVVARAPTAAEAEATLRAAHRRLDVRLTMAEGAGGGNPGEGEGPRHEAPRRGGQ